MQTPPPRFRTGYRVLLALVSLLGMTPAALAGLPARGVSGDCSVSIPRCPVLARARADATGTTASTTTLTASPATLSATQTETLTVTVAPYVTTAGVSYTLTGTVTFYDGSTVLGTATVTANTASITGITLAATVTHTLTAAYSGDATYASSVSSPLVLDATLLPVTVTLAASGAVIAPDNSVTLTATITPVTSPPATGELNPSGYVLFYAGSAVIGGQVAVASGVGDTAVATTTVTNLAAGSYSITATYSGDATFGAATSNAVSITAEDFTVGCDANNINVVQGATGSVNCNVALQGGLTGEVQVVCAEQNPPQEGALQCNFSPEIVNNSGATTLTVITTAGGTATAGFARGGWWLMVALLLPVCLRLRRRGVRFGALCLLLAGIAGSGLGCTNSTAPVQAGTPLGVHTVKITAAELVNTVTVSHYAYLTVNVTTQ